MIEKENTRKDSLQRISQRLLKQVHDLRARAVRWAWARLWIFLGTIILAIAAGRYAYTLGNLILAFGFILFIVVVYVHRRAEAGLGRYSVYLQIKMTHLARQALDWEHLPSPLDSSVTSEHPFAFDLDLTGECSLHHLLDTAISLQGSERLLDWLLAPVPDFTTISQRQKLVSELIPRAAFRDKLTLTGKLTSQRERRWDSSYLVNWVEEAIPNDGLGRIVAILMVLAGVNLIIGLLAANSILPREAILIWLIYFGLYLSRARDVAPLYAEASALYRSLEQIKDVFLYLERAHYPAGSQLDQLCQPLLSQNRPSKALQRLLFVVSAASLQNNIILWGLLNIVFPWDLFFAYQLRQRKRALKSQLPRWLDIWHELEALCSLATFAYLHPQYTFPVIESEGNVWQAEALGHPLIPSDVRVTNDFALPPSGEIVLITGSNMSGKSSFLRTIGVNTVLANAGSVVTAHHLRLSLFRPFTCIKVSDSLVDGFSYFYAEVRRLKALLDALNSDHPLPLLFLIDEIFRGTNNRERLIGSRAYIQALIGAHGTGVISTHDLELTRVGGDTVHNQHFADDLENGRMVFDYQLRPGPSPTTNALKIMEIEGLPVNGAD
jgi:hypothetical protein